MKILEICYIVSILQSFFLRAIEKQAAYFGDAWMLTLLSWDLSLAKRNYHHSALLTRSYPRALCQSCRLVVRVVGTSMIKNTERVSV